MAGDDRHAVTVESALTGDTADTLSGGVCTDSTETADTLDTADRPSGRPARVHTQASRWGEFSHWSHSGGVTPLEQLTHYNARLGRSAHTAVTNR